MGAGISFNLGFDAFSMGRRFGEEMILCTPGIYSPAQIDGWRQVTNAVRQAGGLQYRRNDLRAMHASRGDVGRQP
ncbi:hypothetical protein ABI924_19140, partial [Chromobacterium phragmitis]